MTTVALVGVGSVIGTAIYMITSLFVDPPDPPREERIAIPRARLIGKSR
jgi:hypothetical protein